MADLKTLLGENYKEGMTLEEIGKALEGLDLIDAAKEKVVRKSVFDNTATDVAKYKKMYNDKLTEDEQKAIKEKEILEENAALKKEKTKLSLEAQLAKSGYDEKHIGAFTEAFLNGDIEKLSAVMGTLKTDISKKVEDATKAELLRNNNPKPPAGGNGTGAIKKEEFEKMGYESRLKFKNDSPDLYKEYTGNN